MKKNKKKKITIIIVFVVIVIFAVCLIFGDNVVDKYFSKKVKLTSDKVKSIGLGEETEIPIKIDTNGYEINALEAFLQFDPNKLEVLSVDVENSFVELWITDMPTYDNEKGEVSFAGGVPTPGFNGKGVLATMIVKSKSRGDATLRYTTNSRVLLNDGIGTSVETNYAPIIIKVN